MSEATADEAVEEEIDETGEESTEAAGKSGSKAKLLIIAGVALFVLLGGAGAYVFLFTDMFGGGGAHDEEVAEGSPAVIFYDLPEMVVNLQSGTKKKTYLKILLSLELDEDQDLTMLHKVLPRVVDQFHVYLRELRATDLHGSAGIYRLKEELLRRVATAARPVIIRDVLFKEMLVQ